MLSNMVKSAYVRLWVLPRIHRTYNTMSVAETFRKIYLTKAWGDNGEPFCSGTGSRGPISEQYCAFVTKFIRDHQVQSIVDLGCGDFSVGRQIVEGSGVSLYGHRRGPGINRTSQKHGAGSSCQLSVCRYYEGPATGS